MTGSSSSDPTGEEQVQKCSSFSGFPAKTLLEQGELPFKKLAELCRKEGQSTRPIHRVHRWFARRLSTQFRAILTALTLRPEEAGKFWARYHERLPMNEVIVLDPFVGGGTTLLEASRNGSRVVGYDIDPVAAAITRFSLSARKRQTEIGIAQKLVKPVAEAIRKFHTTEYEGKEVEVLHHFWVELTTCPACNKQFELHPHYQLARDKKNGLQWAFCKHSHEIQELALDRKELRAKNGRRTRIREGTQKGHKAVCPRCGYGRRLGDSDSEQPPEWRLFAQEVLVPDEEGWRGYRRDFKEVTASDKKRYRSAAQLLKEVEDRSGQVRPTRPIPESPRHDRRPLLHGVRRYDQLFNERQLLHLTLLGQTVREAEPEVQEVLSLAFTEHLTTNCMYTGYAFGYRRTSPLFSFHGFRHIVRPVELNPWLDGFGRGTFPNTLRKIERASSYASSPTDLKVTLPIGPEDGRVEVNPAPVISGQAEAAICLSSSDDLSAIPDGAIDLILTDPPYLDNVSYSELSDFYLAWRQQLNVEKGKYADETLTAPLDETLATTERSKAAAEEYGGELEAIFRECKRVLREDGLLVFTYHHKEAVAWWAIGEALAHAGFQATGIVPMRGEGQGGLHTKAGTIKWDAVFVCRKSASQEPLPVGLTESEIELAVTRAERWAQRLRDARFRAPDQLNLTRAFIIGAAKAGSQPISLLEALRSVEIPPTDDT